MKLILAIRPPMNNPLAKYGDMRRVLAAVKTISKNQFMRPILSRGKYSSP
jgi:hypothetical protein